MGRRKSGAASATGDRDCEEAGAGWADGGCDQGFTGVVAGGHGVIEAVFAAGRREAGAGRADHWRVAAFTPLAPPLQGGKVSDWLPGLGGSCGSLARWRCAVPFTKTGHLSGLEHASISSGAKVAGIWISSYIYIGRLCGSKAGRAAAVTARDPQLSRRFQVPDFSFFKTNINCFSLVLNSVGISPVGKA